MLEEGMMKSNAARFGIALALAVACTAGAWAAQDTPSEKLEKLTAGRAAGAPENCVPKSTRTKMQIIDSTAIAVYDSAKRYNISLISGDCSFLKPGRQLVMDGSRPRICAGDPFVVVAGDSDIQYGSCRWGQFIPYPRADK
jgi:hypothetical protein